MFTPEPTATVDTTTQHSSNKRNKVQSIHERFGFDCAGPLLPNDPDGAKTFIVASEQYRADALVGFADNPRSGPTLGGTRQGEPGRGSNFTLGGTRQGEPGGETAEPSPQTA